HTAKLFPYTTLFRSNRSPGVENVEMYSDVPYLNGGLFRPELNDTAAVDERDLDVRDSVLQSIIDLLERYEFSADGGPTDIDPSRSEEHTSELQSRFD